jgi:hypothetical protein
MNMTAEIWINFLIKEEAGTGISKRASCCRKNVKRKHGPSFLNVEENPYFTLLPSPIRDHFWLMWISLTSGFQAPLTSSEAIQTQKI